MHACSRACVCTWTRERKRKRRRARKGKKDGAMRKGERETERAEPKAPTETVAPGMALQFAPELGSLVLAHSTLTHFRGFASTCLACLRVHPSAAPSSSWHRAPIFSSRHCGLDPAIAFRCPRYQTGAGVRSVFALTFSGPREYTICVLRKN